MADIVSELNRLPANFTYPSHVCSPLERILWQVAAATCPMNPPKHFSDCLSVLPVSEDFIEGTSRLVLALLNQGGVEEVFAE